MNKNTIILLISIILPKTTLASDWFYGVYTRYEENKNTLMVPVIGFANEKLSWYGPQLNYKPYNSNKTAINTGIIYEDDNLNYYITLDNDHKGRKFKFDKNIGYSITYKGNKNNGQILDMGIYKKINFGPIFTKLSYNNKSYNSIYSEKMDYPKGELTENQIGLSISTPIFFNGFTILSIKEKNNKHESKTEVSLIFTKKIK